MNTNTRALPTRFVGVSSVLALAAVLLAFALMQNAVQAQSGPGNGGALTFEAELAGGQEVPAVDTATSGRAEVKVNEDMTMADFEVRVEDGIAVTQSHLHCAPAGQNGPVIAFLFGAIPGGFDVDGSLAEFTLTDANILPAGQDCSVPVDDIASLTQALQAGIIYANVHTVANPGGEIRGQMMEEQEEMMMEEEMAEPEEMMDEEEMEEMMEEMM